MAPECGVCGEAVREDEDVELPEGTWVHSGCYELAYVGEAGGVGAGEAEADEAE